MYAVYIFKYHTLTTNWLTYPHFRMLNEIYLYILDYINVSE